MHFPLTSYGPETAPSALPSQQKDVQWLALGLLQACLPSNRIALPRSRLFNLGSFPVEDGKCSDNLLSWERTERRKADTNLV